MNLKNIIVNLSKYNNRNIENFQDTPTTSIANQTTAVITNENKKFYLELKIPDDVDKNFLEILLDDIRNKIDDIDNKDLQILFKNGDVSLKEMDEYLDKLLTKTSCRNEEDTCNISYKPYNEFDFNTLNPNTKKKYTSEEIKDIKKKFKTKCNLDNGEELKKCCDPFDTKLKASIPKYLLNRFKKVDVKKCNNKITKIRVCNDDECGEGNWRNPTPYELCKLKKLKPTDFIEKKWFSDDNLQKLEKDCYYSKCNSGIFLNINDNYNDDEKINDHYYLIQSIKRDDVHQIKEYYETENHNVTEKLLYGYSGNTGFHNAVYYNSFKCIEYLLTTNFDYSNVNKDENSVLHIACLRGNYDCVFKLLKHGCQVECQNKYGDTALHCAVRSGSYNCVKILLQNNAFSCIDQKNLYGEIPLHTAVIPVRYDEESDEEKKKKFKDRMNFNIVKLLVDYGSDIHSKNNEDEIILKTLSKKNKSLVREEIRTFLQKKYYEKSSSDEYNDYLEQYPEIRPFEFVNSNKNNENNENNENNNKNNENNNENNENNENNNENNDSEDSDEEYDNNIDYKKLIVYDEDINNEDLYINKNTRGLKYFPKKSYSSNDTIEHFSTISKCKNKKYKYSTIIGIILLIVIILFILINTIY